MSWRTVQTITSDDGVFLYDWVAVQHIARNFARAKAMLTCSREVLHRQILGPDTVTYDTDFQAVDQQTDEQSRLIVAILHSQAQWRGQLVRNYLISMMQESSALDDQYYQNQRTASKKTMDAIETSVRRGETTEETLKVVRDLSGEILILGASVATGGAASSVILLSGGLLKGAAKYQDTGDLRSAGIEVAATVAFGKLDRYLVPPGVSPDSDKVALKILAHMVGEPGVYFAQASMEGKSSSQTIGGSAMKMGIVAVEAAIPDAELVEKGTQLVAGKGFRIAASLELAKLDVDRLTDRMLDSGSESKGEGGNSLPPVLFPPDNSHLVDALPYDQNFLDQAISQIGDYGADSDDPATAMSVDPTSLLPDLKPADPNAAWARDAIRSFGQGF